MGSGGRVMATGGEHSDRWWEAYQEGIADVQAGVFRLICGGGEAAEQAEGYMVGRAWAEAESLAPRREAEHEAGRGWPRTRKGQRWTGGESQAPSRLRRLCGRGVPVPPTQ